ncbi:MAG TPA: hypothetical protein PLZ43_13440 [bacterium]|nr:hypothetical protein [bacterium]
MLKDNIASLPEGVLFYPCSRSDIFTPIMEFSDWVDQFWFVDKYKYHQGIGISKVFELSEQLSEHFEKTDEMIWEPERRENPEEMSLMHPVIVTETFKRKKDGRKITVNLRRGDGLSCLNKREFGNISVFFYRGDSMGEGGSGQAWFRDRDTRKRFKQVIERIPSGGLIITDGSNCSSKLPLRYFRQNSIYMKDPPDKPEVAKFAYRNKAHIECIGRLYDRVVTAYVWRVVKLNNGECNGTI